jgi:plasmid replication initiation protein
MKELTEYVFKSNDLVRARYTLTVRAHHLLSEIFDRVDGTTNIIALPKTLVEEILKSHYDNQILCDVFNEMSRAFVLVENGTEVRITSWVTDLLPSRDKLTFVVNSAVFRHISGLKINFTKLSKEIIQSLELKQSPRLYELLRMRKKTGVYRVEIEELKGMLVSDYRTNNLISRVIIPCLAEINERSDMTVTYKPIKSGVKITHLEFYIQENIEVSFTERIPESVSTPEPVEEKSKKNKNICQISDKQRNALLKFGIASEDIDRMTYDEATSTLTDCINKANERKSSQAKGPAIKVDMTDNNMQIKF